jgi:Fe-S-cluster containining protein
MICFRCGVCCELYQARFEAEEALRLAEGLGISVPAFIESYADPRWPGKSSHLLRHEHGACVFLERDGKSTKCAVHAHRPNACRQWEAGPEKHECRDGLKREWGLVMAPSGEFDGEPTSLAGFGFYLDCITYGKP